MLLKIGRERYNILTGGTLGTFTANGTRPTNGTRGGGGGGGGGGSGVCDEKGDGVGDT